jgi:hypothetical protein
LVSYQSRSTLDEQNSGYPARNQAAACLQTILLGEGRTKRYKEIYKLMNRSTSPVAKRSLSKALSEILLKVCLKRIPAEIMPPFRIGTL